jgi:hypothetical protein
MTVLLSILTIPISHAAPTVGMEGQIEIDVPGPLLEAKPVTDKAPLLLRIASTQPAAGQATHYDLRYIGLVPGQHDLKNYLLRSDGSAIGDLPSIPVAVEHLLPDNHQGQLIVESAARTPWFGGYRWVMGAVVVAWGLALIPIVRAARKRKRAEVAAPIAPPAPTLADRLRPLIEQAASGTLSADDKGRLERMLLAYWRQRLDLSAHDPAEAILVLRRHEQAGKLLRALEDWLHRPPGRASAAADIAALLEPYKVVEANVENPMPRASNFDPRPATFISPLEGRIT